ncbi:uncharacterized protein LOC133284726 [Gastrolobium bilobum]|uniref:uncharacterized protein LOC133284726 n=1 Tax=Gastrolobium bilobum TaxID=150636 RepID=UPI002AB183F1|nr:uncharacterized protein LOC133284726 [Gastrolobium bilobum]
MDEDRVKASRKRVLSEEDLALRSGKKLKGDVMVDLTMDESMQEKGEGGSVSQSFPGGIPDEIKVGLKINSPSVSSYKDKLLRLNGKGGQADCEEEDWIMKQKKDDEEADLMEGLSHDLLEDPLCPRYTFSLEEHKSDCEIWRKALIIKMLGKRIGTIFLMSRLVRLWCLVGPHELIDLDNGYLLLRFQDDSDYRHVLEEGPWIVNDHYVTVQRWRPFFDPYDKDFRKLAMWVRIPGLPIELYTARHLLRIGNIFGRTLKVDRNSLRKSDVGEGVITERGKFARICVEVDLRRSFLSKFKIGSKVYHAGYEGLHLICFKCGVYGHRKDQCSVDQGTTSNIGKEVTGKDVVDPGKPEKVMVKEEQEEAFGSWMVVQRQARGCKLKAKPVKQGAVDLEVQSSSPNSGILLEANLTKDIGEAVSISPSQEQDPGSQPYPVSCSDHSNKGMDLPPAKASNEGAPAGVGMQNKSKSPKRTLAKETKDKAKPQAKVALRKSGAENIPPNSGLDGSLKVPGKSKARSKTIQEVKEPSAPGSSTHARREQGVTIQSLLGNSVPKGVGKKSFPPLIKDLSHRFNIGIMALLEVKIGGSRGDSIIKQLGFSKSFRNDPVGVQYLDSMKSDLITFIYGSPRRMERKVLWEELISLSLSVDSPWLVMGDFNSILSGSEKVGGKEVCWNSMAEMRHCLIDCNINDMGFKGSDFTWKRGKLHERLDRACSNEEWNIAWPNRIISHLPYFDSDHRPLLLVNDGNFKTRVLQKF